MESKTYQKYQKVVFFDTETTGLDPVNDRIIELAAITCTREAITREVIYVQLEPGKEISQKISDLTGITASDCEKGITEEEMLRLFSKICSVSEGEKCLLVAYNAQFDLNFLEEAYKRHKDAGIHPLRHVDFLDALTVYRDRAEYPHRLSAAIEHYSLEDQVRNTHDACNDAAALKAVVDAMAEERDDLLFYVNLFGVKEKYSVTGSLLKRVNYYRQTSIDGIKSPEDTLPAVYSRLDFFEQIDYEDELLHAGGKKHKSTNVVTMS